MKTCRYNSRRERLTVQQLESRLMLDGSAVITEFMASNRQTLADEDGDFSDWIEIHNPTSMDVDLNGWSLTDDDSDRTRWPFPDLRLSSGAYLILFASQKDRRNPTGELHTNFKLSSDGEYLAIVDSDGNATTEFEPEYPRQQADRSFGLSVDQIEAFFSEPTPGMPNATGTLIDDVEFSRDSGFFDDGFMLSLANRNDLGTIRYTKDGSIPTADSGLSYERPISVSTTTVVRAAVFVDAIMTSRIRTANFIFWDDVLSQSNAQALNSGLPANWGGRVADYEMDQAVIGQNDKYNGKYSATIRDDLRSIPSLAIVVDSESFFGADGIYSNPRERGDEFETTVAGEVLDPIDGRLISFDAGIRIQGGVSRRLGPKRSFRLTFREEFGDTRLDYPFFGEDAAGQFDSIVLRSSSGEQIVEGGMQYVRDAFARRSQLATGNVSASSRFMHLYINGFYWGVYEPTERPDARFAAQYFGGAKDDWDVVNAGLSGDESESAIHGDLNAWTNLLQFVDDLSAATTEIDRQRIYMTMQGRTSDGSIDPTFASYLDVDNYIDYVILNWYVQNRDWPERNFYMARNRSSESSGFKFFSWDAEAALVDGKWNDLNAISNFGNQAIGPARLWPGLVEVDSFRVRFSDRMQQLFSRGGAFYVEAMSPEFDPENPQNNVPAARFMDLVNEFDSPLVAESARWGDAFVSRETANIITRDEVWRRKIDDIVTSFFPNRSNEMVELMKQAGLYRPAPTFSAPARVLAAGERIELLSDGAPIFYTIDGTDPRNPDGSISQNALQYMTPIVVKRSAQIVVRTLQNGDWSARDASTYLVQNQADATSLRISELHYNPREPTPTERDAGYHQKSDFEFIEILNTSDQTINLGKVKLVQSGFGPLTDGVSFDFADSMIKTLKPGGRILVVENQRAFEFRYGQMPIAGQWNGRLDNQEESIALVVDEFVIQQFRYRDRWHPTTDGISFSLESIAPAIVELTEWSRQEAWLPSIRPGGSPGQPPTIAGDSSFDGAFDSSDLVKVFQAGEYEDSVDHNSTFFEGDWNGDGDFTTGDLVFAFAFGLYVTN